MTAPDLTEMVTPGGTWWEPEHVPMLADFECRDCGQIGCDCPPPSDTEQGAPR